jgi:DNA invertase Pin-like site-specific DNA recombinase
MSMNVASYCRVSTEEQNLDRQLEATRDYAEGLGADLADLEVYRDKSTGTNTSRDGYQSFMNDVEAGEIDVVVAKSVSRVARSIRDLDRTAERVTDAGAELHIIDEGLIMKADEEDPYQNALFRLLGVFAELEADLAQKRTQEGLAARMNAEDYHHGPAPLGFDKNDGHLVEAENYGQVVGVLELVEKGELSKRKAAAELDCSRSTIGRALDRSELYGM